MAIVTEEYYLHTWHGEAFEAELPALLARAEDVIGLITHWRVTEDTIASFPAFTQTLIRKAVCAQVDFFAVNGLEVAATGTAGKGFTVGKVSVQATATGSASAHSAADTIAPLALSFLEQTGLLNPQVELAPDMPILAKEWI